MKQSSHTEEASLAKIVATLAGMSVIRLSLEVTHCVMQNGSDKNFHTSKTPCL